MEKEKELNKMTLEDAIQLLETIRKTGRKLDISIDVDNKNSNWIKTMVLSETEA